MTNSKRTFTHQEKDRQVAEFRALQKTEHITGDGFAARAGLSKHTFSRWLSGRDGNKPDTLIKVGLPGRALMRKSGSSIAKPLSERTRMHSPQCSASYNRGESASGAAEYIRLLSFCVALRGGAACSQDSQLS